MAVKHIDILDKSEVMLKVYGKKKYVQKNVIADQIQSIIIENSPIAVAYFFTKPMDKIIIKTSKGTFEFWRKRESKFFDSYITELEEFAKNNKLTFHNTLIEKTGE